MSMQLKYAGKVVFSVNSWQLIERPELTPMSPHLLDPFFSCFRVIKSARLPKRL